MKNKAKPKETPFFEKTVNLLEEGKLYRYIQGAIIFFLVAGTVLSGVDFSTSETTKIYKNEAQKQYHVKKVSQIPKEKEKEEAEKIAVEDDRLTEEELKERYYMYVVNRIEHFKVYPVSEQKKGHEGSIVMKLYIKRDGTIEKVRIVRQARYMKLTRAAINAVKKAHPFKAFSPRIKDELLVLKLEIRFALSGGS